LPANNGGARIAVPIQSFDRPDSISYAAEQTPTPWIWSYPGVGPRTERESEQESIRVKS